MTDRNEMVSVPRWHLSTMAVYIAGGTPDRNTQTPEEVQQTLDVISWLQALYDPYSIPEIRETARDALSRDI
jgi:hypothetical protein